MSQPTSSTNTRQTIKLISYPIGAAEPQPADSPSHKLCGICLEDFHSGDPVAQNGCCGTMACIKCLSVSANMKRDESRGGGLPAWAKCQLCSAQFDRELLNTRFPPEPMSAIEIRNGVEEIDVRIPGTTFEHVVGHLVNSDMDDEEGVAHDDGIEKVTRRRSASTFWYFAKDQQIAIPAEHWLTDQPLTTHDILDEGRRWVKYLPELRMPLEYYVGEGEEYTIYEYPDLYDDDSESDDEEEDDEDDEEDNEDTTKNERQSYWPIRGWWNLI